MGITYAWHCMLVLDFLSVCLQNNSKSYAGIFMILFVDNANNWVQGIFKGSDIIRLISNIGEFYLCCNVIQESTHLTPYNAFCEAGLIYEVNRRLPCFASNICHFLGEKMPYM